MNVLYKLLQGKFEANSTYPGSKVLEMTLQTIRVSFEISVQSQLFIKLLCIFIH